MTETGQAGDGVSKTDLARFTLKMSSKNLVGEHPDTARSKQPNFSRLNFPFASISVLMIFGTLFAMSMERGGWSWSSWTYAFSLGILFPLVFVELKRKAVVTGGAVLLLFFMVLIDAGMPGMFGYHPSDLNWYDNLAHLLGAFVLTLFFWSLLWWTLSPTGPPRENGARKFAIVIATMVIVSVIFEFMEFFTDALFGWTNFHPGIDTVGDLIFDIAGVAAAAVVIGRHKVAAVRRPFWHAEPSG